MSGTLDNSSKLSIVESLLQNYVKEGLLEEAGVNESGTKIYVASPKWSLVEESLRGDLAFEINS